MPTSKSDIEKWQFIAYLDPVKDKDKISRVLRECPEAICYVDDMTDGIVTEYLSIVPNYIKTIENPTYEMKLVALLENPFLALYIDDVTEDLMLWAIEANPEVISIFRRKATKKCFDRALDIDPEVIRFIKDPTIDMMKKAISKKLEIILTLREVPKEVVDYFRKTHPDFESWFRKNRAPQKIESNTGNWLWDF